jgi:hypothetical protein
MQFPGSKIAIAIFSRLQRAASGLAQHFWSNGTFVPVAHFSGGHDDPLGANK